ncbi:aflatoxin biosynthesis ketoreductase nor-1 [Dactylonectria estremocensis]|uniref:Aflatoxin biosynthesis ketoreductase nor-1 n=1 Tax=Dactylonectria estremocensis TaxID=1079267 RepID=A0A9P9EXF1_9HYPO|nr:aflatoxin biosynthesis ketoreductase nor-1 [Dactylonectria estremocensis]
MSAPKTYFITGANRGLGKGFTEKLLQRPGVTVVATARDPAKAAALNSLPKGEGSKLIILKLDSQIDADAAAAVVQLQKDHGIKSLDVVIANAGIMHSGTTVSKTTPDSLRDHFNTNSIGPVTLFQAVSPLLQASSTRNPIFLPISTLLGSIGSQESLAAFPQTFSPYGASKTALNWLVSRLHFEEPWLTTYAVHPGLVLTDMATSVIPAGVDPASVGAIDVDTSITGLLKLLDTATRAEIGGKFKNYDGTPLPW